MYKFFFFLKTSEDHPHIRVEPPVPSSAMDWNWIIAIASLTAWYFVPTPICSSLNRFQKHKYVYHYLLENFLE